MIIWLRGLFGVGVLLLLATALSTNRRAINWRLVAGGMGLQFVLGLAILRVPFVRGMFEYVSRFFIAILDFTGAGATFLFGSLVTDVSTFGFIFAFQVLPTIVFFSALTSLLYYAGPTTSTQCRCHAAGVYCHGDHDQCVFRTGRKR